MASRTLALPLALALALSGCPDSESPVGPTDAPRADASTIEEVDAPPPMDAPVTSDAPATTDAPAATDAPVATDAPAATDAATVDAP